MRNLGFILFMLVGAAAFSQNASVSGLISWKSTGKASSETEIILKYTSHKCKTDKNGAYELTNIPPGSYTIIAFTLGLKSTEMEVNLSPGLNTISFSLDSVAEVLEEIIVQADYGSGFGLMHRQSVDGMDIFAGKKNEVVLLEEVNGNLATNNSRQVYSRVAGLNIWESDQAGTQLGIGGRGLSPNRTSNFNTRQNGYDIAADALGYPESYYTPPTEALSSIDVVRGAASLQYGTQFGGVLNFRMKEGPNDRKIGLESRQTIGSYGLFNSYNALGGRIKNTSYYSFVNYKRGDGWRPNSEFDQFTGFVSVGQQFGQKFSMGVEYTGMRYLAHQPGGLTDDMFENDPSQSIRDRNWFRVDWNIVALKLNYVFNPKWRMEMRNFGLFSSREALGILGYINRPDPGGDRDLLSDVYRNYGNETRLIYTYQILGNPSNLLLGGRYYRGKTNRKQGLASDGSDANFTFNHPDNLEHSEYDFPSQNVAFFAENVFQISPKWSLTPGIRYENILTEAEGYYKYRVNNLAGNALLDTNIADYKHNHRSFVLAGIGTAYKFSNKWEVYSSISQNYRAINFNDMRVNNPNLRVDSNLQDESGYSADAGVRGTVQNLFIFDISAFYLSYNDRIGSVLQTDQRTYRIYRLRTNVSDSRNYGVESYVELDVLQSFGIRKPDWKASVFSNFTFQEAYYIDSEERGYEGNRVEDVPQIIFKTGVNLGYKKLKLSYQYSYTAEQFTDATNSIKTPTAINGIIPSFWVMDLSASYEYKWLGVSAGLNNLTNNSYFTRRADGYPGPGIIPAEPINFYTSLIIKI
ncbi:MAG: TonB-dependent receptor [Flavobacteriales bacterium]|nr:TonB-dependent receptor [Flavobacteriales bacterium]